MRRATRRHALLLTAAALAAPAVAGAREFAESLSAESWREALSKLAKILSRSEFQWEEAARPGPVQQWLRDRVEDLLQFLSRLFPDSLGQGDALTTLLAAISALLIAVVLFYALRGLLSDFARQAALDDAADTAAPLTAGAALERAQTLSGAGDYRSAVRFLYLSCLFSLEERGQLRSDRSLTNREVLRSVADQPGLARLLRDVVDVFDRVWYGFERIGEPTYRHYEARVRALQEGTDLPSLEPGATVGQEEHAR